MRAVDPRTSSSLLNSVANLLDTAFPEDEKVPMEMLVSMCDADGAHLDAFVADPGDGTAEPGDFLGFSMWISDGKKCYILYLAVDANRRSGGIGSRMLADIASRCDNVPTVLEAESVHAECDNLEQRLSRQKFYERNGFTVAPYRSIEYGVLYDIMQKAQVSPEEYIELKGLLFSDLAEHTEIIWPQ